MFVRIEKLLSILFSRNISKNKINELKNFYVIFKLLK